jgi:hypothetical protein
MIKKFCELEFGQGQTSIPAVVSIVADSSEANMMSSKWTKLEPFNLWITSDTW